MRILQIALLLALPYTVSAQAAEQADPLPPPPPPPASVPDTGLEPEVTIHKRGEDTIEEFRIAGKLYMIKVTPPHGRPYYLIDQRGDGRFTRQDSLDPGTRPPMWVIRRF